MTTDRTPDYLRGLIAELRKLPVETGWLEFKKNDSDPQDIGEYLSALANAAALDGKANAYVVWGIENDTHEVAGTSFSPTHTKKGNEDLESWLLRLLDPRRHFRFHELTYEDQPVVLLEIPRASGQPVRFKGVEYIRVGSYRQNLKDHSRTTRGRRDGRIQSSRRLGHHEPRRDSVCQKARRFHNTRTQSHPGD